MTTRVLCPAVGASFATSKTARDVLTRVLEWLKDPGEVDTLVLYASGAHFRGPDGREVVIGVDGEPRLVGVSADTSVTSC